MYTRTHTHTHVYVAIVVACENKHLGSNIFCAPSAQAPSTQSQNRRKQSDFVLCGSGILSKRVIAKPHRAVVNIQGAGSPQKKVEHVKPARIQPARCIQIFSHKEMQPFKLSRNTF